jgi:hypothetical protein
LSVVRPLFWRNAVIKILDNSTRSNYVAMGEISPLLFVLLALALMGIGTPLKAYTIMTYHLRGVLDDGSAFTGTIDYDAKSSKISNIHVTTSPDGTDFPAHETWSKTDLQSGSAAGFTADNGNALITIAFFQQLTGTARDYIGGAYGGAVIGSDTSKNSDGSKKGSVTAVPEPTKLPFVLLGALALIGVPPWRRILQAARKKRSVLQVP